MIVLGLDASTWHIGYAIYNTETGKLGASGEHKLTREEPEQRLYEAVQAVEMTTVFCRQHAGLDVVAIERPFVGMNRKTALLLGMLYGALVVSCRSWKLVPVTPAEAKLAATGRGNADKKLVRQMIMAQFGLNVPIGEHQADAVAVALAAAGKVKEASYA